MGLAFPAADRPDVGHELLERNPHRPRPEKSPPRKICGAKSIAACNIVLNLLILGIFKYFNFFGENLSNLFRLFGFGLDWVTVDILLPVGISFYTFQALSYTIDVYRGSIAPTHDPVGFFAYVSFFPQLVAGPIERATHLLPQFHKKRSFDFASAVSGTRQIMWGLFKKVVIADNCAVIVNSVFANYSDVTGSTLFLGAVFFAFQIYGDFSGYSDIAIGCARLFGIDLMQNFKYPYFSRDIAEFWRRWHISLTTWFRDYIYIPLGGSRAGKWKSFRNTLVIFLVSGFWHGANWTFVAWGAYHALLFLPLLLLGQNRRYRDSVAENSFLPSVKELTQMGATFLLVLLGWILFRSEDISQAAVYLERMFNVSLFSAPQLVGLGFGQLLLKKCFFFTALMFVVEWIGRKQAHGLMIEDLSLPVRYVIYTVLLIIIYGFDASNPQGFIYFQF